jgi:Squalene-hopene cyclase C-terminal domain
MKKLLLIVFISSFIVAFKSFDNDKSKETSVAVKKSLQLLQSSSHTFLVNAGGCHSCHGQGLGAIAFSLAKENGFEVKEEIVKEAVDSICDGWKGRVEYLAQNSDPVAIIMAGDYDLWALTATQYKPTKIIELLALNIMRRQNKNGSWVSPNMRPPLEYYSFTATAMTVKNIQHYIPAILNDEVKMRVDKAKQWLMKAIPETNEEKVFQLLGLLWCNGDKIFIKQQAEKLLTTQHKDGGWSQLDSLSSDAYATGQSLYALNQCGYLPATIPSYQAGVDFLLQTQYADGSWKVKTRSFPGVPFVESGFPHGDDQFISAAGSNWATMALILAAGKKE